MKELTNEQKLQVLEIAKYLYNSEKSTNYTEIIKIYVELLTTLSIGKPFTKDEYKEYLKALQETQE